MEGTCYETQKLSMFTVYNTGGEVRSFGWEICMGAVSDLYGGRLCCWVLHTPSTSVHRPEGGFANSLNLTWGRLCHSHGVLDLAMPMSTICIHSGLHPCSTNAYYEGSKRIRKLDMHVAVPFGCL